MAVVELEHAQFRPPPTRKLRYHRALTRLYNIILFKLRSNQWRSEDPATTSTLF